MKTSRPRLSLGVAALAAVSLAGSVQGCKREGASGPTDSFDRRALLASLTTNVILPVHRDARDGAVALKAATAASLAAVATADEAARLADARLAWKAAMVRWQEAEVMQLGPAGPAAKYTGGRGLRDEIYSWPTVNSCRVDQEIVDAQYRDAGFFDAELVNVYGLDALEYLLFHEGPDNTCPSQTTINASGTWAALGQAEITRRRADYADAVAERVVADMQALVSAWEPAEGNFAAQLSTAGSGGSAYGSAHGAVNELFAAMFYVELKVKDAKLAVPAGLSPDCVATVCPEAVESRWADHSTENISANLRAFRKLFTGGAPGSEASLGFDDFLVELGAPALATEMIAETDAAIAVVDSMGSFQATLTADRAKAVAAYDAVKVLTDDLKSQFVTVLNLSVPDEGAADND